MAGFLYRPDGTVGSGRSLSRADAVSLVNDNGTEGCGISTDGQGVHRVSADIGGCRKVVAFYKTRQGARKWLAFVSGGAKE